MFDNAWEVFGLIVVIGMVIAYAIFIIWFGKQLNDLHK